MSYTGLTVENKVTGERAVVVTGTDETNGELGIYDLFVAPSGAVAGEHIHPNIEERFTVIKGKRFHHSGTFLWRQSNKKFRLNKHYLTDLWKFKLKPPNTTRPSLG